MGLPDLGSLKERPALPARRAALFAARDAMATAAIAAAASPALALPAAQAKRPALNVVHGFCDQQSMSLWLQARSSQTFDVVCTPQTGGAPVQRLRVQPDPREDYATTLRLAGLEPGTAYRYTVRSAQAGQSTVLAQGEFRTQPLWQWRGDPPTVRIATGSCAYLNDGRFDRPGTPYGAGEEIFDCIAAERADLMLWLGDNIYLREPEWTSLEGINQRYRFYREHPALRKLWQASPHVAIWDDHDFGPNDSNATFVNRGWTRAMFDRYWPTPFAPQQDGTYGMVSVGDIDIFMLDDRSSRAPDTWPEDDPDKTMFGPTQMRWLQGALLSSRARFKLVAGGSQFWNKTSRFDCLTHYPAEEARLRNWLEARKIPGVVFLSGDRHFAQLLRIERPGLYPLYELTTSALTSSPPAKIDQAELDNPDLAPGTLYPQRNYAVITASGPAKARELRIELKSNTGALVWEWKASAAELAAPQAA
ncbi:alkaline phosphatase D family protein [Xylophilus sp. GW821-FHT01B05]